MLQDEIVRNIRRLVAEEKYSQRTIARITGVSRAVVHRIATGKRKDRTKKIREEWEQDWAGKPYKRCPLCGCRTRLPCLACIIRRMAAKETLSREKLQKTLRIELELEERHRIRYEQVRAWRETQKDPDFSEVPENWPFRKRWKTQRTK